MIQLTGIQILTSTQHECMWRVVRITFKLAQKGSELKLILPYNNIPCFITSALYCFICVPTDPSVPFVQNRAFPYVPQFSGEVDCVPTPSAS